MVMQFGAKLIICLSLRSGSLRSLHGLGGRLFSELISTAQEHPTFIHFGAVALFGAHFLPLSQGGNSRCSFCGMADKCLPVFRFTKSFELLELSASVVVCLPDEIF